MSAITLKVNGQTPLLELDRAAPLLYALSDEFELRPSPPKGSITLCSRSRELPNPYMARRDALRILLWLIVVVVLVIAFAFYRFHAPRNDLNVTLMSRTIDKAKRR